MDIMPITYTELSLLEHSLLLASVTLASAFCFLYLRQLQKNQKITQDLDTLKETETKGYSILHKAFRKAQAILGKAELEGVKVVADNRVLARKLEGELEKAYQLKIEKAENDFNLFLDNLKVKSEQIQALNEQVIKQRTEEVFQRFESHLAALLASTEQKSIKAVEDELKSMRELINRYKTEQMNLIDENIIATLEKTLSLVLVKKISLKDETELVFEALEKAKTENFIV